MILTDYFLLSFLWGPQIRSEKFGSILYFLNFSVPIFIIVLRSYKGIILYHFKT